MTAGAWEMVVGLEVHVQLRTRTKTFCDCAVAFAAEPNSNTCPVCLALPGALPVLNARAVELAVRAALALGCTVHEESRFARKHYFYPDLPKGYQISQYDGPLATGGAVDIGGDHAIAPRRVGVTRLHMEEDAGKSIHDRFPMATAIDLNRAGVPLIEIVSEPDLRSAREAGAYLRALRRLLDYLDVSDLNMEEGSLRVDANISIRPAGSAALGTRTEVKNLNSFSGVERALEAEYARQVAVLSSGGSIEQQTMLWDEARGEIRPARAKEGSHDYRYFPDPDLPPLRLDPDWIMSMRDALPELPAARRRRFERDLALDPVDADALVADPAIADYFESLARSHGDAKTAANWVMGEVRALLKSSEGGIAAFPVPPEALAGILDLVRDGTLSTTAGKRVLAIMHEERASGHARHAREIAEREGLTQVGDAGQLEQWVDDAIAADPGTWARLVAGERKLLGVFVGAVMQRSGSRADPRKVSQLLSARAAAP
jgi:aspartyl-tRNA(Asn)/glutamyl-tRNA(Gln) amidotransferase subunit B